MIFFFFFAAVIPQNLSKKQSLQFVGLFMDVCLFKVNLSMLEKVLLWDMDSFFNTQRSERVLSCSGRELMQGNLALWFSGLCCVSFRSPVKSYLNGVSGTRLMFLAVQPQLTYRIAPLTLKSFISCTQCDYWEHRKCQCCSDPLPSSVQW